MQFTKFDCFTEDMAHKVHDLSSDTLILALTNTEPQATDADITDITEISYTNISDRTLVVASSAQSGGVYTLKITDKELTASGTVPTFQWFVIYNNDATNKELLGYADYGAEVNLTNGAQLTVDFDGTDGVFTLG